MVVVTLGTRVWLWVWVWVGRCGWVGGCVCVGASYFVNDFQNFCKKYQNLSNNVKKCQKLFFT